MLKTSSGGLVGAEADAAKTRHRPEHFKEMVLTDKRANSSVAPDVSVEEDRNRQLSTLIGLCETFALSLFLDLG